MAREVELLVSRIPCLLFFPLFFPPFRFRWVLAKCQLSSSLREILNHCSSTLLAGTKTRSKVLLFAILRILNTRSPMPVVETLRLLCLGYPSSDVFGSYLADHQPRRDERDTPKPKVESGSADRPKQFDTVEAVRDRLSLE